MSNWFINNHLKICIALVAVPPLLAVAAFVEPIQGLVNMVLGTSLSVYAAVAIAVIFVLVLCVTFFRMSWGFLKSRQYKKGLLILAIGLLPYPIAVLAVSVYEKTYIFESALRDAEGGNLKAVMRLADARSTGNIYADLIVIWGQPVSRFGSSRAIEKSEAAKISALIENIEKRAGKDSVIDNCLAANLYMYGLNDAAEKLEEMTSLGEKRVLLLKKAAELIAKNKKIDSQIPASEPCNSGYTGSTITMMLYSLEKNPELLEMIGGPAVVKQLRDQL